MEALLVVDVQNEYIKRYEEDLLNRINKRIEKAALDNEMVIYIQNIKVLRGEEKKDPLANGLNISSSNVFSKKKASAFSNMELVEFVREKEITNMEIVGVDGNSCVFSTAKDGKKYMSSVTVNCNYIGVVNGQRFEKTKKTLNELGVEIY